MADWFGKLMQRGHGRGRRAIEGRRVSKRGDAGASVDARDARHDAVVQMLRDREVEVRDARERRLRGYRQCLAPDTVIGSGSSIGLSPVRLCKFSTKVPCRMTPEARALLDELRNQFSGSTITFPQLTGRQQIVMLTRSGQTEPKQIGRLEHCVQTDQKLCNARHQGLKVEIDDAGMLVLRFHYPPTAARMQSEHHAEHPSVPDDVVCVEFAETRPALDLRPTEKGASPRLVWVTRPEVETMNALQSRDYEAFYTRFKLEVLAGIWSSLSSAFSSAPSSHWHRGSYYTVVRESDPTNGRIYQRTLDDSGQRVDIGEDRVYNAVPATDILLLYLDGDILADFADIYFTLQNLGSADAYFLKEELFTVVRRFWAGSQSLASRYGSDLAAVLRMCQRAVPTPAQASLLKQDWTNLRQSLIDRYGETGRRAAGLVGDEIHRPRVGAAGWPFASFPAGEVNVGLRIVYRQEWRHLGAKRGDVIRAVPPNATAKGECVETIIKNGTTRTLDEVVNDAVDAAVEAMKWSLDSDGRILTGMRDLAAKSDLGLDSEYRESSRDTSARLSEIIHKMMSKTREETAEASAEPERPSSNETESSDDRVAATYVYSRLQNEYEVLTAPAEIQNVILVAEKLPAPVEIDLSWVRLHDWILATALLDESFRDALETIAHQSNSDLDVRRDRLYEHIRANILHYQRAMWRQEDPQQRSMRYRKSGKKVPVDWQFELESGATLTVDELADRLLGENVDGQFAAYSTGREADLDQVIDPAGPIGYYGNYAIYHMRPEFGSNELFSMLHFFKSPYLTPSANDGEPHVDRLVCGERSRRITLDTTGVVIDVMRADTTVAKRSAGGLAGAEAPQEYQLVMEGRIELLSAHGQRGAGAEADWLVLGEDGEQTRTMRAGAPHPPEAEQEIRARLENEHKLNMHVGQRHPVEVDWAGVAENIATRCGTVKTQALAILEPGNNGEIDSLRVGRAHEAETDAAVHVRNCDEHTLNIEVGRSHDSAVEPLSLPAGNEGVKPGLSLGQGHDPKVEQIIFGSDNGQPTLSVSAGAGVASATDREAEQVLLARGDGERTLTLLAGAASVHDRESERVILGRVDEWMRPSLVAG